MSLLIPFAYKVPTSKFAEAVEAKTPQTILSILNPYARVVEHVIGKSEDLAEAEGLKLLRREAALTMREAFTGLPYVLSYLILCELECRDLTYTALALEHGLDPRGYLTCSI